MTNWIGKDVIEIIDKKHCCGCTACASICPKNCIEMLPDEEGFLYPHVDITQCINCGLCENKCPIINSHELHGNPEAIIVRNKDEDILEDSTSGGAFTAIAASLIIEKNARIYGAAFDDEFHVKHLGIDSTVDLRFFRGSKFVQSDVRGIFSKIKNELINGKTVLFSGTPCQIYGLKNYLGDEYVNLYCCDIVCRGVPSPLLWNEYLKWIKAKYKSNITKVKFRNKTYGYHSSTMLIEFSNGRIYKKSGRIDPMMRLFTKEMCSRPSCSECMFKTKQRVSDLTLFDCKRYTKLTGKEDDDKGYTAILIQSEKGRKLVELASNNLQIEYTDVDNLIEQCGIMVLGRAQSNPKRNVLFDKLTKESLDSITNELCNIGLKDKVIENAKAVLYFTGLISFARKLKKHEDISINEEKIKK